MPRSPDQLDVTQAQAEDVIQPHGMADDLPETGAGDQANSGSCCQPRPANVPAPAPANLAMPTAMKQSVDLVNGMISDRCKDIVR